VSHGIQGRGNHGNHGHEVRTRGNPIQGHGNPWTYGTGIQGLRKGVTGLQVARKGVTDIQFSNFTF
jgi:hypothetical protein